MKIARPRLSFLFFLVFPALFSILLMTGCGQGTMTSNPNPMSGPTPPPAVTNPNNFVYVTVNDTSTIAGLKIDPSGNVSAIAGSPFPAPEGPVGLARTQDFVFVGSAGLLPLTVDKSVITTFRLDQTTGAITQVAVTHSLFPYNLAVDPSGRFLYSNGVAVFSIGTNGQLTALPGSPFGGASSLDDMQGPLVFHSCGKFLYSNGWFSGHNSSPTAIFASVDPASGVPSNGQMLGPLTLNLAITSSGKFMVAADWEAGVQNGICTYTLDPITGAPSGAVLGGQPVTPVACAGAGAFVMDLAVNPGDSFVATAGNSGVSMFRLSSGSLSPVAGSPFAASSSLSLLNFSRDGMYLFAAGPVNPGSPGQVTIFRVDAANGTLIPAPGSPFALNGQPFRLLP